MLWSTCDTLQSTANSKRWIVIASCLNRDDFQSVIKYHNTWISNRDAIVSQSTGLAAEGSRVQGSGSCNAVTLEPGSLIHKIRTGQDMMAVCLSNALCDDFKKVNLNLYLLKRLIPWKKLLLVKYIAFQTATLLYHLSDMIRFYPSSPIAKML